MSQAPDGTRAQTSPLARTSSSFFASSSRHSISCALMLFTSSTHGSPGSAMLAMLLRCTCFPDGVMGTRRAYDWLPPLLRRPLLVRRLRGDGVTMPRRPPPPCMFLICSSSWLIVRAFDIASASALVARPCRFCTCDRSSCSTPISRCASPCASSYRACSSPSCARNVSLSADSLEYVSRIVCRRTHG